VSQRAFDLSFWSHHHNPRTVANNPAGEITLNLGLTGPAYCIGAACAARNLGLIHAAQMLQLGEIDLAIGGGVSRASTRSGSSRASRPRVRSLHEDPTKASRPFDKARNGIVVAEAVPVRPRAPRGRGGARSADPRRDRRLVRQLDASDFVLRRRPPERVHPRRAPRASRPTRSTSVSHATSTPLGDEQRCQARAVFGDSART
jgi:3-oxoacyl-[acyl-carrier-protein] synthase II